jgi:hypothetical protein
MDGGYLNIPKGLRTNSKFSCDEKFVLAEIIALSKLPKGCIASDSHFAELINKSRQSANQLIKRLQSKGYLDLDVKPGIGKTTTLTNVFWNLLKESPVKLPDTKVAIKIEEGVELPDITYQKTGQVGVGNSDTTCRDLDTINTINNTSLKLQEELQYTGATVDSSIENIDNQYQDACLKLIELITTDPSQITNPFVKQFQDSFAGLYLFFGHNFIDNCHIFKSNSELYEIYSSSNFYEVRQDLQFVRDNMDRFLRQQNWI